ncbi:ATP-dependent DNA helicase RecQ [Roseburia sp. OF03-24]|uniref:RecQ family ATP-dependent DNA helicase n=1 Tax=Roseburia sp. OF03-24 TaxID=2292367 RepID=UPI000E4EAF67|nr:ATP-dependent DNA helicase RecQ [Roseburia sp. OF03-24]RGX94545.1 ATP-dependent DNA helicase RecQ [Roseburia sp. OF03-24]
MNLYQTLKHYFGYDTLRTGQQELMEGILKGKDVLGIMPTGAGKSLCYQVPALMLSGITIVISPLISLMSDQVKALNQAGVHAAYINSSLTENQIRAALLYAAQGKYKIIYVAPERLNTMRFLDFACQADISMVTVDEAHCISQWGQDFRPSYLEIADFLARLPGRPVVSAFTATATERVKQDITGSLHLQNPVTVVTGFDRPNLFFRVVKRKGGKETDNSILNYVKRHEDESGIIYCATKKNVDSVCELLLQHGILAGRYHAGLSLEERKESQDDFTYDRIRVMVATNAFGMGIDKSNVRYVLHYNMPQSLEYYYQEAGRAGRDGEEAECVLFFSKQDIMINKRLLDYKATEGGYTSGDPAVRANEQRKLNQMIGYCETDQCLRQFILNYFGDHSPCTCEKCSNCVVMEDEAEENYIQTGKAKKKTAELADLTQEGQELFELLRKCRAELAAKQGVPPFIICSDKTIKDMCAKCPTDEIQMADVYGMGVQKIASYGDNFTEIIRKFLETHKMEAMAAGKSKIGGMIVETVSKAPARKTKRPFSITPEKLDEVVLSDACMLSELTDQINALCSAKDMKKLTAASVNDLLVQKGYLKEEEQEENRIKRVTEKGIAVGIQEEERRSKFGGGHYYALIHTRKSQEMIIAELKEYFSDIV